MDFNDLVPFKQGLKELPGSPHVSAGYRFIKKGCRGVKLETIVVGGRRWVSRTALRKFVEDVTRAANDGNVGNAASDDPVREDAISKALDQEGL